MKQLLTKLSALFLVFGGILYITVQFIHPPDVLHSVTSSEWMLVSSLTSLMGLILFLGLIGHFSLYVERIKWLGSIGFVLFGLFWLLTMVFSFVEAFVLPLLVETSPDFVEGMVGLFGSEPSLVPLGIFPVLVNLAGIMYILGGVLYGISGYRADLPGKFNYLFLTIAALLTIISGSIGHPLDRFLAIPMGLALIWMGYNVWQEESETIAEVSAEV